jgi:hypothetical protein
MLRPFLILSIAFLISTEAMAKFRVCYYGGYTFSGNEYSDKYDLKQINNLSSCRDPLLQASAAEINRDYLSNNKKILYDSGRKGNMGKSSAPINLTLDAPQDSKKLETHQLEAPPKVLECTKKPGKMLHYLKSSAGHIAMSV